jgi:hypothetical protein
MASKGSRLNRLENFLNPRNNGLIYVEHPALGDKIPTESGDYIFRNYIISLEEFEHHTVEEYGIIKHAFRDISKKEDWIRSLRSQNYPDPEGSYQKLVDDQKRDQKPYEDIYIGEKHISEITLQEYRELTLLWILDYPHRIDFDIRFIGKRMKDRIKDIERSNEFLKPENRLPIPKESDFSLEHFKPLVKRGEHTEYEYC